MEGLENLGKVQMTIQSLHSAGIYDDNPDNERFLAHFTLFMTQQCGEIDVSTKCRLISKHISKMSSACFRDASECGGEGHIQTDKPVLLRCATNSSQDTIHSLCSDGAMIGMEAMLRSNSTLEDFVILYVSQNGRESSTINFQIPAHAFLHRKLYLSGELASEITFLIKLDGLNEKLLPGGLTDFEVTELFRKLLNVSDQYQFTLEVFEVQDYDPNMSVKSVRVLGEDPFRPLLIVLERQGLLTKRIIQELRSGEEYWALERKLCCALVSSEKISIEDVTRAIHLKSFDYRVLNLLLYQLRGEKVNDLHMEFLSTSELLVEVSDDLFDYEDDIFENNFNILRMFVRYYGASAAPIMLAKFVAEAEVKYNQLFKALDSELSMKYQKRCEEATKEGGKMSGPSLGTWHLPPIIEDEIGYRMTFSSSAP